MRGAMRQRSASESCQLAIAPLRTRRRSRIAPPKQHRTRCDASKATAEVGPDGAVMYRFGAAEAPAAPASPSASTSGAAAAAAAAAPAAAPAKRRFQSSWDAKEAGGGSSPQADYLYEVGQSEVSMNIDTGQNAIHLDSVFTGNDLFALGHQSDIADGSLRDWDFRSLNNIVGDYYVAPKFLDAVAMHVVKNFLVDAGSFDASTRVPLILGIWGGKGQGKSFQTELVFKKLGLEAIIMSAGELESERAGEPGRLIRDRYRRAAELSRVRGKLSALMINDIDIGLGMFENTQRTVNNQMVVGSLMSICDNPNRVTMYNVEWRDDQKDNRRIPIIATGNDMSTIFAPLVRDGRMEKFYWHPTREDLTSIIWQMYRDDGVSREGVGALVDAFPGQSLDFFGALRASTYDNQIREWIKRDVIHGDITEENENLGDLGRRLVRQEGLPTFEAVQLSVEGLMAEGRRLAAEQDMINSMRLSQEYYKKSDATGGLIGLSGDG